MASQSAQDSIRDLLSAKLNWLPGGLTILGGAAPPFDLAKPNIHDSKGEFLLERNTVRDSIDHLTAALALLVRPEEERDADYNKMVGRLIEIISSHTVRSSERKPLKDARDVAIRNVVDTGFFFNAIVVNFDLLAALKSRLEELDRQEKEFWSISHRPPNYYARTIALRFAKFYARQAQTKPTFGISSEGAHPSTDYGRLLEEIFGILKIKANVRGAAEWALPQITEADFQPPPSALVGLGNYFDAAPTGSRTQKISPEK